MLAQHLLRVMGWHDEVKAYSVVIGDCEGDQKCLGRTCAGATALRRAMSAASGACKIGVCMCGGLMPALKLMRGYVRACCT